MGSRIVFSLLMCAVVVVASQTCCAMEDIWELPVDVAFKDVQLGDALGTLLKDTGISCVVDPRVSQLKVTAILKNVSLKAATEELFKAAGAVGRGLDNWIVVVPASYEAGATGALQQQLAELVAKLGMEKEFKTDGHPDIRALKGAIEEVERKLQEEYARREVAASPGGAAPAVNTSQSEVIHTEVIPLRYLNPADVAPGLASMPGMRLATSTAGKLVLTGTREAIRQALELIEKLDIEPARNELVRVKAVFGVRVTEGKGKPKFFNVITEGVGTSGQAIPLGLSPLNRPAQPFELLTLTVTPTIGSGPIVLSGKGSFNCPLPMASVREFGIAGSVPPGKAKTVAGGSVSKDSVEVEFQVQMTAWVEEGNP